jgi:hypothetical protein
LQDPAHIEIRRARRALRGDRQFARRPVDAQSSPRLAARPARRSTNCRAAHSSPRSSRRAHASFIIIVLPIWESKDQILAVFDGIFHTNLCEYYNPETSKQHKLHQAAAAAEPAKAADPVS